MTALEVSAGLGALVLHVASAAGASAEDLCRATGFDPAAAADPDARIPLVQELALWSEAARLTRDEAFGVHAAEVLRPGAFDVMDYAVRTAPTLRVSLERLVRYNRLVHDTAEFALVDRGEIVRVEHAFRTTAIVQERHSAEFTIAAVLVIGSQIAGTKLRPLGVEFRHARPASLDAVAELVRFFGVEPRFARSKNAVELDRATTLLRNPAADPSLWRVIERHAEALLAAKPDVTASTSDRVRQALASMLGDGDATLTAVAERLRTSERSLQRKLADDGSTFDAVLDGLRRDLALRYLADPKIAIAEVAYLLGYSEPSPFHRAFKRWTGRTPAEARRRAA